MRERIMKRFWMFSLMLAAVLGFNAGPATATAVLPTLEILPAAQDVQLGDSVEVAITISYLGDFMAPSLGVFDIDFVFDASVLSLSSVAFGDPVLGDQLDLFGFGSIALATPSDPAGSVNLFELSFDLPEDLIDLQAASFTLATLSFDAVGLGSSNLTLGVISLGDQDGAPLFFEAIDGAVNVVPVPEPGAALLFGAGMLVVSRALRRRTA